MQLRWQSRTIKELVVEGKAKELPSNRDPNCRGVYVLSVSKEVSEREKISPRYIYIGGMKKGKTSSLSKRIGELVSVTLGFTDAFHTLAGELPKFCEKNGLDPFSLVIHWAEADDDPVCAEAGLFLSFKNTFNKERPELNGNVKRGCDEHNPTCFAGPWN